MSGPVFVDGNADAAELAGLVSYLTEGYWRDQGYAPHAFHTGASNRISVDLGALDDAGRQLARWAFEAWEMVADVVFVETGGSADIRFDDARSGAFTNAMWAAGSGDIVRADVNVSTDWLADYGTGIDSHSFATYVHEIGHALGLGHPGDYNSSAEYRRDATFAVDSRQVSIMSYFDQDEAGGGTDAALASVMIADILAIQALYGAPSGGGVTGGDTVWGRGSNLGGYAGRLFGAQAEAAAPGLLTENAPLAFTIYDQGGHDHLDLRFSNAGDRVSLTGGAFSDVDGAVGNMAIARGTVIEDASTGHGDDLIRGNGAANRLAGGRGNDTIEGGDGDDRLLGGAGDDRLFGQGGQDRIEGGEGRDRGAGGAGADDLRGGAGRDTLSGGAGDDTLGGDGGADRLVGQGGRDRIEGGRGDDRAEGGAGDDRLFGQGGRDTLLGGAGDDQARGGGGDDLVRGGAGDDRLFGQAGSDTLDGGAGADRASGGADDDDLQGRAGDDTLSGGGGDDTLRGGTGQDRLRGGDAADRLFGQGGRDRIEGGRGVDRAEGGAGDDRLLGQGGNDTLWGGAGDDRLEGGDGRDLLDGGAGDDILAGGRGADSFVFGAGSDTILDFGAADRLRLSGDLWSGRLDAGQVIDRFLRVGASDVQLDFGTDELRLAGFTDLDALENAIVII